MRRTGIVVLLVVALGSVSAAAGGTVEVPPPGWGPVVDLTPPAASTYSPELAAGPHGSVLAVWTVGERGRSRVMAAWRRPAGTWTAPRRVPGTRGAMEADIAFDRAGDLVLAWTAGRRVSVVRRPAGGPWGTPVTLHRTPAGALGTLPAGLELAANPHGRAVVCWHTIDDDRDSAYAPSRVQAAVGGPNGRWGRVHTLSPTDRQGFDPEAAMSRAGRATVVWDEVAGSRSAEVMVASQVAGRGWSRSLALSTRLGHPAAPQLAALPSGELAVAWNVGGTTPGIRLRRWHPAGGWGSTVRVPGVRAEAWWLDLAVDGSGAVTLAWSNQARAVWSARQSPSGTWTRTRVAPAGSVFVDVRVLADRRGDAIIGWDGSRGDRHVVEAAYRPRGGGWGPPTVLSDPGGDAGGLTLALDGRGNATAAWLFARDVRSPDRVQARHLPAP